MSRPARAFVALAAIATLAAACAPEGDRGSGPEQRQPSAESRVLNVAIRYEIESLLPKMYQSAIQGDKGFFNAALTLTDEEGALRPYLAEVPHLNTDTWRVFPDGRMETVYKLRPGLSWHDGHALTAEDFVFAWRLYTDPNLDVFLRSPQQLMEAVVAADPQTLVIRWNSAYPDADSIRPEDLDPLPRHILEQPLSNLQSTGRDAFLSLPYWRSEYVGTGPYRLVAWEPGSHLEGEAFDGYVLGRPKIKRIVLRVIPDENTTLTNILAGSIDISSGASLRFEHGQQLLRDWVPTGKGVVRFNRGGAQTEWVQLRAEYVGHPALLDVRVRRALAHSLDRQAINDGIFDGHGFPTETMVPETEPFFGDVDRAVMKYPFDVRRTEQLMNDAGFFKDRDGLFANPTGERYSLPYLGIAGPEFERGQLILADAWRRAGIDVQPSILPAAQVAAGEHRHTYPGISTRGGGRAERNWITAEIGGPQNRWTGENRSGWSNAEYDQLYEAFQTTLDRVERTRQFVRMQRLISEHLPTFFTHFSVSGGAQVADLRGPRESSAGTGTFTRGGGFRAFHEWEWR